jgi:hypothetical protein
MTHHCDGPAKTAWHGAVFPGPISGESTTSKPTEPLAISESNERFADRHSHPPREDVTPFETTRVARVSMLDVLLPPRHPYGMSIPDATTVQ